jgi:hypothetical protein
MHDETPGGIALKDRTLAFWMDQNNFSQPTPTENFFKGAIVGFFVSLAFSMIGN